MNNEQWAYGRNVCGENCENKLEQWLSDVKKRTSGLLGVISLPGLGYMFIQLLFYANDNIDEIPKVPIWICLIYLIVFAIVIWTVYRTDRETKLKYERYKDLCKIEKLMLFDEELRAVTEKGELVLRYEQINSVSVVNAAPIEAGAGEFSNDILIIEDVVKNRFHFYSFINCQAIKMAIENRQKNEEIKDDSM